MKNILQHSVTRIILGLSVCLVVFITTQNIAASQLKDTGKEFRNLFKGIVASIGVIGAYRCSSDGWKKWQLPKSLPNKW